MSISSHMWTILNFMAYDISMLKSARILLQEGVLVLCLFCAPAAHAIDALWLQGLYYDNTNKLNLKEGIAFMGTPIEHKSSVEPWPYSVSHLFTPT